MKLNLLLSVRSRGYLTVTVGLSSWLVTSYVTVGKKSYDTLVMYKSVNIIWYDWYGNNVLGIMSDDTHYCTGPETSQSQSSLWASLPEFTSMVAAAVSSATNMATPCYSILA